MTLRQKVKLITVFAISLGFTACASGPKQRVDLKKIYDKSAQYHAPDRNAVIVIPGILGSRLIDDETGKTVWGAFRAEYACLLYTSPSPRDRG